MGTAGGSARGRRRRPGFLDGQLWGSATWPLPVETRLGESCGALAERPHSLARTVEPHWHQLRPEFSGLVQERSGLCPAAPHPCRQAAVSTGSRRLKSKVTADALAQLLGAAFARSGLARQVYIPHVDRDKGQIDRQLTDS